MKKDDKVEEEKLLIVYPDSGVTAEPIIQNNNEKEIPIPEQKSLQRLTSIKKKVNLLKKEANSTKKLKTIQKEYKDMDISLLYDLSFSTIHIKPHPIFRKYIRM